MARVQGKVAIVTGGAKGIGKATALRLAEEGASVAIFDMLDDAAEVVALIEAAGGEAAFEKLDITVEDQVAEATARVNARFGAVDILVNNAGIAGVNKLTHEVEESDWDKIFAINVKGVFFCSKHALPYMMKRKAGSIVNFSSVYGLVGNNDIPPYHATKGAVLMMTKTDAVSYAPWGIRVNAIHPGSTKTELFMQAAESYVDGKEAYLELMGRNHPLTLGEPVDVANCVLFLASDESRFVTGASLVCDGGYTAQ